MNSPLPTGLPRALALLALAVAAACRAGDRPLPEPAPDVTPPAVPQGLTATSTFPTRVTLGWTAATDAGTGVGGYEVLRGGVVIATVAAPATAYQDDAVVAATSYSYAVRAFDLAEPPNVSALSATAGVTTPASSPDTSPPTVPGNVTATASDPARVVVSWSASTDAGAGVAGYEVLRGGALRGTVAAPATSFEDATVTAGTSYAYAVRAYDAAVPPNVSATSSAANVTTPTPQPDPGLDARPSNPDCVAPARPTPGGGVRLVEPYPNLPGFSAPVAMLQAPGDATRWYVVEQTGAVRSFDATDPAVSSVATFVDLSGKVRYDGESGLLGMAFHPSWPAIRQVFLSYMTSSDSWVSRFTSTDGGATLDPASEQVIVRVNREARNHNGGGIAFGPDGLLYVAFGDGGGSGDQFGNGQRLSSLLAKFLRLDVSVGGAGYAVPAGNPYAGNPQCGPRYQDNTQPCPEMWAFGFRNPWRWSFDRATGDLWAGDVGQGSYEEVDRVVVGRNYGWSYREGAHCFNPSSGCPAPGETRSGGVITDPVVEYPQAGNGNAVTGGYVYRGGDVPALSGLYVFGDYGSGNVWTHTPGVQGSRTLLLPTGLNLSSFAESNDGELYAVNLGGTLHRFEAASAGTDLVWDSLADSGCVDAADPTRPAAGLIPYRLNAPFWSDGAVKARWMALPDGATVTLGADGDFDFPDGTVLVKTFRVGGKLVETRLLMRHPDGVWGGYTYEWNDAETGATRVRGGRVRDVGGQAWTYPSESECLQCHTQAAGRSLGPELAQLNGDLTYPTTGRTANQLTTLQAIGVFTAPGLPGAPATLPALPDPLGAAAPAPRARAWLHSNCSQCHRPGGPTNVTMDLRHTTSFAATGTCDVVPANGTLGLPGARIVAPGAPGSSVLLGRVGALDVNRMPPLGSNVVDEAGAALLEAWIAQLAGCP